MELLMLPIIVLMQKQLLPFIVLMLKQLLPFLSQQLIQQKQLLNLDQIIHLLLTEAYHNQLRNQCLALIMQHLELNSHTSWLCHFLSQQRTILQPVQASWDLFLMDPKPINWLDQLLA
jgi:hypothetical protein